MTTNELVKQVLRGNLVLVGEYRGSYAEMAGYVDKKSGQAISYVRGIHLVECDWYGRVDRVLLFEYFPETVGSVEEAEATFTYERGRKYVFYLEWFKRERGQLTGRLAEWDPEPLEIAEEAVGSPQGEPPPLLTLSYWKQFHRTMTKSKAAFLFASRTLGKQRLYLWTFTFKELLAVKETRKRWNHLLTLLLRQWPGLQGLRVLSSMRSTAYTSISLRISLSTLIELVSLRGRQDGDEFTSRECQASIQATWRNTYRKSGRNAYFDGGSGLDSGRVGNGPALRT